MYAGKPNGQASAGRADQFAHRARPSPSGGAAADSGYIDVSEEKHYFYWLLESRRNATSDPLILWLNGGPGCSSMIGMLAEKIGPCEINEDLTERNNPYSWTNNATVIFVDAPNGAGYSYGSDLASNTREYAEDVYQFFQLFFDAYPQYAELDLHIFGTRRAHEEDRYGLRP